MARAKSLKFVKQNETGLYEKIQKIGCFFRSAAHMAEMQEKKALTKAEINELWLEAIEKGYIGTTKAGEKDCVLNSAAIANIALVKLGNKKGRFVEVGLFRNGITSYYAGVPMSSRRIDYLIQKIRQNGPSGTHFRNVYRDGLVAWDPHDPKIVAQGIYYSILYIYVE